MARLIGNGRYVLGKRLGVGGMGAVYAAEDLARTERVAIKLAHGDEIVPDVVAEHMARELRAGRAIEHPNIVRILDGGNESGRPFLVMELASGCTLDVFAASARLSIRRAATIVDQILAGLAALHAAGYVHGDLKSGNVLVARAEDGSDVVKIIDLGLAREHGAATPATSSERVISGTPHYLAPEIVRGGAKSVASELYAVGVILYELLTGTPPFYGGTVFEILHRQVEEEVVAPSQRAPALKLSLGLERVVLRSLRKDPGARYASANEFRAALRAAIIASRDAPIAKRVFSTTASTMAWTQPDLPPPRPRALGTSSALAGSAVRDPHAVVEAALDATRTLVAAHRLSDARDALEVALEALDQDVSGTRIAWRLLLPLAAICDALHDPRRARRLARVALDVAARAGSDVGRRRAKALIERFAGRSHVFA